jgi:drug/metabolite transporter (DMT)-like permease
VSANSSALSIVVCVLLGAAGQILLKTGASNPALVAQLNAGSLAGFGLRALTSPAILCGFLLYGASAALWLVILARTQISYAYPFISLGFIITTLYGWQFLGEQLSAVRAGGVALIILGVILVSRT